MTFGGVGRSCSNKVSSFNTRFQFSVALNTAGLLFTRRGEIRCHRLSIKHPLRKARIVLANRAPSFFTSLTLHAQAPEPTFLYHTIYLIVLIKLFISQSQSYFPMVRMGMRQFFSQRSNHPKSVLGLKHNALCRK